MVAARCFAPTPPARDCEAFPAHSEATFRMAVTDRMARRSTSEHTLA
ncbi:MAG TPA: hypothetical protein VN520_01165 [Streptomyces sp.]|nr:hypothetical protein [Streptomyces sp.]HWU05012.1 hypothetical protein [Streptomyces sp.]